MNSATVLKNLLVRNVISEEQSKLIESFLASRTFSVFNELRFILYGGILLLTSGLGVIIYENIDTIGHQVIIAFIALVSASCFFHAFKNRLPFSWEKTTGSNKLAGYSLLLGCVTFLILEGYLQYQYQLFGSKYGFAVIIPTVLFFFCSYRFDHTGVLSMGITGLASWLGLTIAPLSLLSGNDFTDQSLLVSAIILGCCMVVFSKVSETRDIKKHFAFTYLFLGGNLAAVTSVTGLLNHDFKIVYFIVSAMLTVYFIIQARNNQWALFLLMGVIYGYIALSYSLFKIAPDFVPEIFALWYFLFSSMGVLWFLLNFKKLLGIKK
ncbi:DUF2157 domain-containing protein [Dyadobacter sp. CY312]|uniref:DUF2157 domain-containing protein n=1 Tax=Dyadobacter sp. CY312 TaxID=2907303 RepID=UPI001F287BFD|nr:DUF2157 domain-containing protein [Dyadobacter sp. CY312]MCE7040532.1 DUF2157 domain-containing protein [Dyadobacter sp. CY312]